MSEEFKTIVWFHRVISSPTATDELGMISFPAPFQLSIPLHPCCIPCFSKCRRMRVPRGSGCDQHSNLWHQAAWDAPTMPPTTLQCFATLPRRALTKTLCFPLVGWDLGKLGCRQSTGQNPIALTCAERRNLCLEPQNREAPSRNFIHFHLGWQRPLVY